MYEDLPLFIFEVFEALVDDMNDKFIVSRMIWQLQSKQYTHICITGIKCLERLKGQTLMLLFLNLILWLLSN